MNSRQAHAALVALADREKAAFLQRFFKTGKGEYAEGDQFLGIMVPAVRRVARSFLQLGLDDLSHLLASAHNEERLLALLILVDHYRRGDRAGKAAVYRCYMQNRNRVNNWNLVDFSAPAIIGAHLLSRKRSLIYKLARSRSLWDRRIAVLATFAFIRAGDFSDTFELTRQLLTDEHDLMHKACGWMLREIGKRDRRALEDFLTEHSAAMPRTMFRYAIERLPIRVRRRYLMTCRGARR